MKIIDDIFHGESIYFKMILYNDIIEKIWLRVKNFYFDDLLIGKDNSRNVKYIRWTISEIQSPGARVSGVKIKNLKLNDVKTKTNLYILRRRVT